ncbi:MAG: PASTA domain-containing protein [Bacteriovoracaceae bacterium]|nr:PASTA domain-containing protein [Bacteriovoracaceae bacterium]
MNDNLLKRFKFTFLFFAIAFTMVLAKAFKVQVIDSKKLIAKSKGQFFRETKVYPKRGNIYDRGGNPLALNIQTYSIFTIPKNLKGDLTIYKKLEEIVPSLTYSKILKKTRKRKKFTWLGRKIKLEKSQVERIKKLKGVYIESVPQRMYPNHELLSQTLGFVGVDNVGLSGLEYLFDKELKGKPRILKYIIDNKGRPVKYESKSAGGESQDIHLTIDKDTQYIAEKYLREAVIKHNADRGGIGVMDTETGEILAVANYPTFDPNELKKSSAKARKLSFVSDPIEPGSTLKIVTAVSALENKIARPDTNYYCEQGRLKVEDHIISEAESKKKYEWLSLREIIKYSSNVGTTKIAFDLTYPRLRETFNKFNLGEKTGIELPGESRGIYTSDENVSPLTLSNMSFGQGIATTGIQMLSIYSTIANGGIYRRPTIIKGGNIEDRSSRILSEEIAKEMTDILVEAVEDGTGGNARITYFKIAGKTSTAQRPDKSGGYSGYTPGFIGYPATGDDKFVIYVYIENPKTKIYYGNSVAAPVFKKVAQHILYKRKEVSGLAIDDEKIDNRAIDTVKIKQSSTRISGSGKIPNLVGLDKMSALKFGIKLGLKFKHQGIGIVSKQLPEAGSPLSKDTVVELFYTAPKYD